MKRAIVIAHFDPDGHIDDYVVDALRHYRKAAGAVILVSASTTEPPRHVCALIDRFIARDNVGYDFCSWRAGIESLGSLDGLDELICVNDSVYGPLSDLGAVLHDARIAQSDVWGMCRSMQGTAVRGHAPTPHIQSWFIAMRRPVLESGAFRSFWNSVIPLATKAEVIERYEIGLSACLLDAGFRLSSIHDSAAAPPMPWQELMPMLSPLSPSRSWRLFRRALRGAERHNPAEMRPIRLIRDGVPYIKSSVFRVNHYRINLRHVEREVRSLSGYDLGMIRRHQERLASPTARAHRP